MEMQKVIIGTAWGSGDAMTFATLVPDGKTYLTEYLRRRGWGRDPNETLVYAVCGVWYSYWTDRKLPEDDPEFGRKTQIALNAIFDKHAL
jgi:hypothetical protein